MRYNSQLIDEVIGVAQATFAPEPKLANRAITDDSSSEEEISKKTTATDDKKQSQADVSDNDSQKDVKQDSKQDSKQANEESVDATYKKAQASKKK